MDIKINIKLNLLNIIDICFQEILEYNLNFDKIIFKILKLLKIKNILIYDKQKTLIQ